MIHLTENQFYLVQDFYDVLISVEDAFEYIIESFTDLEKTEGDRLLVDIFHTFPRIVLVNCYLMTLFKGISSIEKALSRFAAVAEKAELLEGKFDDAPSKQTIIREQLYPAFLAWNVMIQKELKPYILS